MDRELRLHYRVDSVLPDEHDENQFIAKYRILDDDRNEYFPFEIRVPKDVSPAGEYWQPVFEAVEQFYSRKEDILTYSYKIIRLVIEQIFKQTKKAPPKKVPTAKTPNPKKKESKSDA